MKDVAFYLMIIAVKLVFDAIIGYRGYNYHRDYDEMIKQLRKLNENIEALKLIHGGKYR